MRSRALVGSLLPSAIGPPDVPLLCILVGVNTPKDQAEDGIVEESSSATAVAGSQAGDANQSLNRLGLHHVNEDASSAGKQARAAEDAASMPASARSIAS